MELINTDLIDVNTQLHNRHEVIEKFAKMLAKNGRIQDTEGFLKDVYIREDEVSTSMGLGVAIPHTQSVYVIKPSLVFIKLEDAITWNEDNNIEFVFGIAVPLKSQCEQHLRILSNLARKLMDSEFRKGLSNITTQEEGLSFLEFINNEQM